MPSTLDQTQETEFLKNPDLAIEPVSEPSLGANGVSGLPVYVKR